MTPKEELLNRAAQEYKAFYQALDGLNEGQLTEAWLGSWSVKDIVAHIVGWHREMTPALERLARGERPMPEGVSYDDVDAWNAKFAAAMRDREVTGVLLEFDKSHEAFLHAAAALPAGQDRVEDRRPQQRAPLQGARRRDPRLARFPGPVTRRGAPPPFRTSPRVGWRRRSRRSTSRLARLAGIIHERRWRDRAGGAGCGPRGGAARSGPASSRPPRAARRSGEWVTEPDPRGRPLRQDPPATCDDRS